MDDPRNLEELKDVGAGRPAPSYVTHLYRKAFADYGARALWNWRALEQPTITQALAIADSLRMEGNLAARALAAQIEQACRAAV
jgi:hypothetical protein